jgi:hypothetical protein
MLRRSNLPQEPTPVFTLAHDPFNGHWLAGVEGVSPRLTSGASAAEAVNSARVYLDTHYKFSLLAGTWVRK